MHAKDWTTWMLVVAQSAWGYGAMQIFLDGKAMLAVAAFLPLPLLAYLFRREHQSGLELYRMQRARAAMEAVLGNDDPRPCLRELLESAQSAFFDETLAVYSRDAAGAFDPVACAGSLEFSPDDGMDIQTRLRSLAASGGRDPATGPKETWALYPIRLKGIYYGALLAYRHKPINDPIARVELLVLAADIAPVIANVNEIVAAQDAANVDALTGILNRTGLDSRMRSVFSAGREMRGCSLMLDVDHFKEVNDSSGHVYGDAVLRDLAGVIAENCRAGDVIGRYGGEEFLILLQGAGCIEALEIAERIRCAVSDRLHVTVSIGLTEYTGIEPPDAVVARADRALYDAKRAGRNRCIAA
jgi:diguanylate cyclase (GGDEF)-like protein